MEIVRYIMLTEADEKLKLVCISQKIPNKANSDSMLDAHVAHESIGPVHRTHHIEEPQKLRVSGSKRFLRRGIESSAEKWH